MAGQSEPVIEEQRRRRDKYAKAVARPVPVSTAGGEESTGSVPSFAKVSQLKDALAKRTQQIELMQKAFVERRLLVQPTTPVSYQGQYVVPLSPYTPGVFNQQPPSTLVPLPSLVPPTMAPVPVVMPVLQNVAQPRWMTSATGVAPAAAAASFGPRRPTLTPQGACFGCCQRGHLR